MSAIDNADDMSAIAKAWKMQMNYISNMKKETFALKVGDKVNWTYRGLPKKVLFRKLIVQLSMLLLLVCNSVQMYCYPSSNVDVRRIEYDTRKNYNRVIFDLTGPQGNAFFLLGQVKSIGEYRGFSATKIKTSVMR